MAAGCYGNQLLGIPAVTSEEPVKISNFFVIV